MRERDNLIPLSTKEWDAFTPKQRWDVIVALRGPDVARSEIIKWFTTSVIRGKMREVMRVGGQVNNDLNLIILPAGMSAPDLVARPVKAAGYYGEYFDGPNPIHIGHAKECGYCSWLEKELEYHRGRQRWESYHFLTHTSEAAEILSIPIFTVPPEAWVEALNTGYYQKAIKSFARYASDAPRSKTHAKELDRHYSVLSSNGGY
jgi:hypothetical protein